MKHTFELAARAFRARPLIVGTALGSFALSFAPLLGSPGYESSLVFGLLGSFLVPYFAQRAAEAASTPFERIVRGARTGAEMGLVTLLVLSLRALFGENCDGLDGYGFFVLTALFGAVLAGAWGGLVRTLSVGRGVLVRRLDVALPFLFLVWFGVEFYATPAVYGFSPFAGFFAGPLYDTVYFPWARLLSYRVGSAFLLAALLLFAKAREANVALRTRRMVGGFGILAALGASIMSAEGARLGHRTTRPFLESVLEGRVTQGLCDVYYSPRVATKVARRLAWECSRHVTDLRALLGFRSEERIAVFLFRDEHEKGDLLGARSTNVSKPWRREVYVEVSEFPHPVLRHELVHALSGEWGRGPFEVPGLFFGLLPDPARIEGLAVYGAAHGGPYAQNLLAYSKAQKDIGELPALSSLFGMSFYRSAGPQAYSAVGALFDFLGETRDKTSIERFYRGESLESITGQSAPEVEREFRSALDRVAPDPDVLRIAKLKFSARPVFARRCPQRVGRLEDRLAAECGGNEKTLTKTVVELEHFDPGVERHRIGAASCLLAADLPEAAKEMLQGVEKEALLPWDRAELLRILAEVEFFKQPDSFEPILEKLREAEALAASPGSLRAIQILRKAAESGEADFAKAVLALGDLEAGELPSGFIEPVSREEPPIFLYLRGRLLRATRPYAAFELLKKARHRLPSKELEFSAVRAMIEADCDHAASFGAEELTFSDEEFTKDEILALESYKYFCRYE